MTKSVIPFLPGADSIEVSTQYGVSVKVSNNLNSPGCFVLLEQEAWFESELAFLQRALLPGSYIADVGANVGIYARALSRVAGPGGRVVAVEPHPQAGDLLASNAAVPDGAPIEIDRRAVSDRVGKRSFRFGPVSELSGLVDSGGDVVVSTVSVDSMIKELGWRRLDFLKIDVEGAELEAIAGAEETFLATGPIVLLEVQNNDHLHFGPLRRICERGYEAYRLVPGLGVLEPVPQSFELIGLNLFAVKRVQADSLEARGLLLRKQLETDKADGIDYATTLDALAAYFAGLAPAAENSTTAKRWRAAFDDPQMRGYLMGCADLRAARDSRNSVKSRAALCARALGHLELAARERPSISRLVSLLVCTSMIGNRPKSRQIARQLVERATSGTEDSSGEPAIVPIPHFETTCHNGDAVRWLNAMALRASLHQYHYSSFYFPFHALQIVDRIHSIGYATLETERVRQLCAIGFSKQSGVVSSHYFDLADVSFQNRALWQRAARGLT